MLGLLPFLCNSIWGVRVSISWQTFFGALKNKGNSCVTWALKLDLLETAEGGTCAEEWVQKDFLNQVPAVHVCVIQRLRLLIIILVFLFLFLSEQRSCLYLELLYFWAILNTTVTLWFFVALLLGYCGVFGGGGVLVLWLFNFRRC